MSRYYDIDEYKYPSVTTIIGDCTDKSGALTQWGSNECVAWIRENCPRVFDVMESSHGIFDIDDLYVTEQDLNDARFAYKTVSKEALDVGTEVHNAIEDYLKSGNRRYTQEDNEQVDNAFNAFIDWSKEVDLKPIALEKTVYGNGWAGTMDFLGYMNDKLYVIDYKTSKAFYPEMRYQVAAYRSAVEAEASQDAQNNVIDGYGGISCVAYDNEFDRLNPQGCGVLRLDKTTGIPEFKDTSKSYESDLKIFNCMVDLYFARHPIIRKKAGR